MPAIQNGFVFVAFVMFVSGGLLALQKYTGWKVFRIVPPLVWIYVLHMVFCTVGLYKSEACDAAYSSLKNNLLYSMIFVMLLRCDFRKLAKLGGRLIAIFLGGSVTLGIGFVLLYPVFAKALGGAENTWGATAALYASWVGGSANMAAMGEALPVDEGAYACALALDTVCYSLWIALLLFAVRLAPKWNKVTGADTTRLRELADIANREVAGEKKQASAGDWVFLIGLAFIVSALAQKVGIAMNTGLKAIGLGMFDKGTCTTLFVTALGLVCAMTPLGKLPAVEELSMVLLYTVVSLLATQSPLNALIEAPAWVLFGMLILVVHAILMFLLSRLFHWDLCMVSTASVANIGGSASAPIVATAYSSTYAGIGVLMGALGAAIGNFFGLGMGAILKLFVD